MAGLRESLTFFNMCLRPYFDLREELVVQGNLIFKGPRLVVPVCIRKELMSMAHKIMRPYWYRRLFGVGLRMPLLAYDGVQCQRLCFQV